ncbi:hypothetical protein [Algoriphagus halophilus]|nr:hypothetical protein [Algoriphagus halophilus]
MKKALSCLMIIGLLVACEQPLDPIIKSVDQTNLLLQSHVWQLEDFKVEVRESDIPAPILFGLGESTAGPGVYDLDDMVFDATDMREYTVIFGSSGEMITSGGPIDALGDSIASYFVFNDRTIRISNDKAKLNYRYLYNEQENSISLRLTADEANSLISDINNKLIDAISKRTPNKLGDLVAGLLFNNEKIQKLINDLIVSALAGELEFINEFDPEEAADLLAGKIIEALETVDWEGKLTELLKAELEKITNIDPDEVAGKISAEVANAINEALSRENIYDLVFPFLNELATNPDEIAESISTLIVSKFLDVFNEENLKILVASAWEKFTELDDDQVAEISSELTSVVENVWINEENFKQLFLPFTSKIENTSILQMGALAKEATESLQELITKINEEFPDLNLTPDYEKIEGQIKAVFIAAKPVIGLAGGAEKAAEDIGKLIISQFLNTENLNTVFIGAINSLQELDPELVGSTIATWLVNLTDKVSPELIEKLSDLLSPILDNINPELTAFKIAEALNGFIKENITQEKIQVLVQPAVEFIANINAEALARFIARGILSLDIIKDTINEDNMVAILLPIFQSISDLNPENLSQGIIDAVVQSGIFEEVITEERVSAIISLIMYKSLWEQVQVANNFKEATIILSHK